MTLVSDGYSPDEARHVRASKGLFTGVGYVVKYCEGREGAGIGWVEGTFLNLRPKPYK